MRIDLIFWVVLFFSLFSGFSASTVGTAFFGDLFCVLAFPFALTKVWTSQRSARQRAFVLFLTAAPLCFLALDVLNGAPTDNLIKGFGRNLVFCWSAIGIYAVALRYGLNGALAVLVCSFLSYTGAVALGFGDQTLLNNYGIGAYLKFHNLIYVALLVYLLFEVSFVFGTIATVVTALAVLVFGDFRSGTIFVITPLLSLPIVSLAKRFPAKLVVIATFLIAAVFIPILFTFYIDPRYFEQEVIDRRETSNAARQEMIDFALAEIQARPWLGYGSWSNAERFVSQYTKEIISVHSAVLQYMYEYGVFGGVFMLIMAALAFVSFEKIISAYSSMGKIRMWSYSALIFIWLQFSFNVAMGGVLGYTRIVAGVSAGVLWFVLRLTAERLEHLAIAIGPHLHDRLPQNSRARK